MFNPRSTIARKNNTSTHIPRQQHKPAPRHTTRRRTFHVLYMLSTYTCDLLKRYGSNGKNESSGLDPRPRPPAFVTLDGVHALPDTDKDDRGVEQEKLEPTVIVWDTCGRCA